MALPMPGRTRNRSAGWLDAARDVALLDVAAELGLDVGRDGRSFGPCPACGEATRNNPGRALDRRGRCRVTPDGAGWLCCSNGSDGCGATGDGLTLVAWSLTGRPWAKGDRGAGDAMRAWYAERGWCPPADGQPWKPPARPRAVAPRPPEPQARPRPALDELRALWRRCAPVTADPEVAAWLSGRSDGPIDPAAVAALDLARALPADLVNLPRWAFKDGAPWTASGLRLLVRAWEAAPDGAGLRRASVQARNVRPGCLKKDKAAWPAMGFGSGGGLVFADNPDLLAPGLPLLELAEGVPDWLRLVIDRAARPEGLRSAVLGVVSGSATPEVAALVPVGWTVAIRTHADGQGDKYAAEWGGLLTPRGCELRRQRKANAPPVAPVPGPADLVADPMTAACDGLRDARDGAELALVWHLVCCDCGGPERVPEPVAALHRQAVEGLSAVERGLYRAKVRELGGEDG